MPDVPAVALSMPPPDAICLPFEARPRPAWLPPPSALVGRAVLQGLDDAATAAKPDVMLCVSHHSAEAHQVARAAAGLGVPWAVWPLIHTDARRHVNSTAVRLYRSAALVVASSTHERRWLTEEAGLSPARTLRLECGSWAAALPMRELRSPGPDGPALLTVGELAAHKRLGDQVEALARLRAAGVAARLTIAGVARGRGELDRLARLVRDMDLERAVRLLPDAAEATIESLYQSADYFLFTSASESFGLALLDAICAGAYPLVYPHVTYTALVEASGFGRVTQRATPQALAAAIRQAVDDGAPHAAPLAAWRAAHAWPRVAASLAARLRELAA